MGWSQEEGQSHLTAQTSYWCAMWFLSAVISSLNMSQSHSRSVTSLKRSYDSIFNRYVILLKSEALVYLTTTIF